ncbi:hypothetical protein J2X76_004666 [Neorhizobium sp. 2083]|uniref:hypothetical protein n=1 Tax=Neorhizobium sp. 2083 TaxID=2817762 RepID=UPI000DE0352B|nr:hypothetical protein [Neorhizobium sp. 2083]MDR6819474.1 hypothetical protein [Neorhizobium sp. 2083]
MTASFKAWFPIFCLLPGLAAAAERCAIEKAVFVEATAGTVLSFKPVGSNAAVVSHLFTITGGKLKLDGNVMYDDESERPGGMVTNNCPQGDATGAELRACTLWTGVPYALDVATGRIDILGAADTPAPDAILMPGFGPAIRHSALWGKSGLSRVPWDLYQFKECKA